MYTDEMRRAFRSVPPVQGFKVEVLDNDHFLVVRLDTESLMRLSGEDKKRAVIYAIQVKEALEQAGAVVLVTRTPYEDR
jgi:hypothetical protein